MSVKPVNTPPSASQQPSLATRATAALTGLVNSAISHLSLEIPKELLDLQDLINKFNITSQPKRDELAERVKALSNKYTEGDVKILVDTIHEALRNKSNSTEKLKESFHAAIRTYLGKSLDKSKSHLFQELKNCFEDAQRYNQGLSPIRRFDPQTLSNPLSDKPVETIPLTSKQQVRAIQKQVKLLKQNSIKMTFAQTILYSLCGIFKFSEISKNRRSILEILNLKDDQLSRETADLCRKIEGRNTDVNLFGLLIQISNEVAGKRDSNEVFKELVDAVIQASDISPVLKTLVMLLSTVLFKIISLYMNPIFDSVEKHLAAFGRLSPEEQTQDLINLMVNPIKAYLTNVTATYESLKAPQPLKPADPNQSLQSLDQSTSGLLKARLIDRFPTEFKEGVYNKFTSVFLKQHLHHKEHWSIREAIHSVLRYVIAGIAVPALMNSTKRALQLGEKNGLQSMKITILKMLRNVNHGPKAAVSSAPATKVSPELVQHFKTFLDELFRTLDEQNKSSQNSMTDQIKEPAKMALAQMLAEMFVQQGFINGILLSSLESINIGSFAPQSIPLDAAESLDEDLKAELVNLSEGVLEKVKENLGTSNENQLLANEVVDQLKERAHQFYLGVQDCYAGSIEKLERYGNNLFTFFINQDKRVQRNPDVNNVLQGQMTVYGNLTLELAELIAMLKKSTPFNKDAITSLFREKSSRFDIPTQKEINNILAGLKEETKAHHQELFTKALLALIQDKANSFADWADRDLKHVPVPFNQTFGQKGIAYIGAAVLSSEPVKNATSTKIVSYADALFEFLGNPQHFDNLTLFTLKGYTEMRGRPLPKIQRKSPPLQVLPPVAPKPAPAQVLPKAAPKPVSPLPPKWDKNMHFWVGD